MEDGREAADGRMCRCCAARGRKGVEEGRGTADGRKEYYDIGEIIYTT